MEIKVFSERVKQLRENRKLSQSDIAKKLGITSSAISSYESGIAKPSVDILEQLAIFFNVSTDYLLGLENRRAFLLNDFYNERQDSILKILDIIDNELQHENKK